MEAREDKSTRWKNAILAHSLNVALPHELTLEQNIFLVRDFVREQFTRKGYAVDWAMHAPDPRGDSRNIHLHILVPLRKIDGDSFGIKDRYTKRQLSQKVSGLRKSWAVLANRHLKRYGHKAQIDERSLKAQGSKQIPTRHQGVRPKSSRVQLDSLRAKQPPQPISPIMRTSKQTQSDGSIVVKGVITCPALNKIKLDRQRFSPSPVLAAAPQRGWPREAVLDWEAWGYINPPMFFSKWIELAPPGFVAIGMGAPSP